VLENYSVYKKNIIGERDMLIELFGDSTQQSADHVEIQRLLRVQYGRHDATVVNRGVGRMWTRKQIKGGDFIASVVFVKTWEEIMRTSQADVVINNCALNDAWQDYSVADHDKDFKQMSKAARNAPKPKKFIMETSNPMDAQSKYRPRANVAVEVINADKKRAKLMETFAKALIQLAHSRGDVLIDQYHTITRWYVGPAIPGGWQAAMVDPPGRVGMHPDENLLTYKAKVTAKALDLNWSKLSK
jgi:hypothetical protein